MNKKYSIVTLVALIVMGGALYFGTATHRASAATRPTVYTDESSTLSIEEKTQLKSVVAILNKLKSTASSPAEKKYYQLVIVDGYCFAKKGGLYIFLTECSN